MRRMLPKLIYNPEVVAIMSSATDRAHLRVAPTRYEMNNAPTGIRGETRTPLYFAGRSGPLFGCHHEPTSASIRDSAVLMCYPFGQEYIRAHRSFAQLASRLANSGFPTLRFDYFACGDSAGDTEQGTMERWLMDILAAADELRRRSGCTTVNFVGLRLGAALAALACQRRSDVSSLVLWDPVVNGAEYLAELREGHKRLLRFAYLTPVKANGQAAQGEEALGFPLSAELRAELEDLDLLALGPLPARRVLVVESGRRRASKPPPDRTVGMGPVVEQVGTPDRKVWELEPFRRIVPHRTLTAIVGWLTGVRA